MQDHYGARVSYPVVGRRPPTSARAAAGEVMRWLFTGKGMLTYSRSLDAGAGLSEFGLR